MFPFIRFNALGWSPLSEFDRLRPVGGNEAPPTEIATPDVNAYEQADRYVLVVDLPGVEESAVHLGIEDGMLELEAPSPAAAPEGGRPLRIERGTRQYRRAFQLPEGVKAEAIEASLKNGVLTIVLPRSEADKPRKIDVKAA